MRIAIAALPLLTSCSLLFMEKPPSSPQAGERVHCTSSLGFAAWDTVLALSNIAYAGIVVSADEKSPNATPFAITAAVLGVTHIASATAGAGWSSRCEKARRLESAPFKEAAPRPVVPQEVVGTSKTTQRVDPVSDTTIVTFSYTALPGFTINLQAQARNSQLLGDAISVAITSTDESRLRGGQSLLVYSAGAPLAKVPLKLSRTLLSGVPTLTATGTIAAPEFIAKAESVLALELRIGAAVIALPSTSIQNLKTLLAYAKVNSSR